MNQIILVRHGETAWNASKKLQGQADIGLSERGQLQIKTLATAIRRFSPDSVVASDLLRTQQTVELLGWPKAEVDSRWREAELGEWTGLLANDLVKSDEQRYQRWRDGIEAPPGGETMQVFRARVISAFDAIRHRKGNTLVVTHGGVIRALLATTIGLDSSRIVAVQPGSMTVLQLQPNSVRLAIYNHAPFTHNEQIAD